MKPLRKIKSLLNKKKNSVRKRNRENYKKLELKYFIKFPVRSQIARKAKAFFEATIIVKTSKKINPNV